MSATSLPARQQLFIAEYLVDGNGQRAAIAAGYGVPGAAVAAHRLLNNDKVKAVLQAGQQAHAKRLMLKREDMADALFEAADMARAQRNPMALVAAARALIKLFGLDAPHRVEIEMSASASDASARMSNMTDLQLREIIAGGRACLDMV